MLAANAMDFDDLLVRTVNVLELSEEARERWRRTFRHVLVDEYQDTNHAQYRLLQLLTEEHGNLMVVGDEDQSIYGFRHADIRNILDFERDFPEAEVVKLEQNYRSTQTILSAANAVVERNRERRPKQLWTEIAGGEPVRLSELTDEHEEARWVAGEIGRLAEEDGVKREDVAVFYRTNAMSRVLEDTLNRFDLPYQVIGGTKFYERAEIKDAVAYLSLLANPADQVSFARIVNSPRRGIGNTTQGRIASHANTTGKTIWEVVESVEEVPGLNGGAIKAVSRFYETMAGLRERALEEGPVAGLLEAVLNESGYLEALSAERTIEAEGRAENLEALIAGAAEFDIEREQEGESEIPPLEEYLQQISLYTAAGRAARGRVADHADDPAQRQGPRVRHGLHRRLRGRRLPAHAGAGRGGRGGGAAALLRRHHPRSPAPLHDLGARTQPLRPLRAQPALALRRRAAGRADRAPLERAGLGCRHRLGLRRGRGSADRSRPDPGAADRRRRRPRQLRRRGGDRGRGGRRRRRALCRRRQRAQADGRLRADPEALVAARMIDGKAVAAAVREQVAAEVVGFAAERGRTPQLATVIVGDDPASEVYVRNKHRACEEAGMRSAHHGLAAETSEAELLELVERARRATTTSTASSSSCRFPTRSTPIVSSPRSTPPRTSTA